MFCWENYFKIYVESFLINLLTLQLSNPSTSILQLLTNYHLQACGFYLHQQAITSGMWFSVQVDSQGTFAL